MRKNLLATVVSLAVLHAAFAQPVPAPEENIPFLVTFGAQAETWWGDDDHCQVFFFAIPRECQQPFYIRVFDPDCGGQHDEINGGFNSATKFSVYGGQKCISHADARTVEPIGNFKSGNLLVSKVFSSTSQYDNQWYTFGPFNPSEGELAPQWGGFIFKVICEGLSGDDGNLYRYYLSSRKDYNTPVEGGNAFTFEYTFRLHTDPFQTSHIFPFVDDKVVSIMQSNFDWDNDGYIKIHSVATLGESLTTSGDNNWAHSVYRVKERERGKSLDIQFTKNDRVNVNNNNVVFYLTNQYGEMLPFFTVPIGGVPVFEGKAVVKPLDK